MKTVAISILLFILMLLACNLCLPVNAFAQNKVQSKKRASKQTLKEKKQMRKLELESPDKRHVVIFSKPTPGYENEDVPFWRKIELLDKKNGSLSVIEDATKIEQSDAIAFEPLYDEDSKWSPDGRFLVVYHYLRIEPQPVKEEIHFLDLCFETWVSFADKEKKHHGGGYGFVEWKPNEPHTMIIRSYGQDVVDAMPEVDGELTPCD